MNKELTIVARIEAKADKTDFVKSEMLKLILPTRSEQGCLQYDLHQDNSNPEVFLFFERWENRGLWLMHMESNHLQKYAKATEGCIEGVTLNEMTKTEC